MIIDDSDIVRKTLAGKLLGAGYEVCELPSGIGASREILRQKVDAVLVDVSMPGLSGDGLVAVLKKTPRLERLVIILVTGETESRIAELRRTSAADAIISKARIDTELLPTLNKLLRRATEQVV